MLHHLCLRSVAWLWGGLGVYCAVGLQAAHDAAGNGALRVLGLNTGWVYLSYCLRNTSISVVAG